MGVLGTSLNPGAAFDLIFSIGRNGTALKVWCSTVEIGNWRRGYCEAGLGLTRIMRRLAEGLGAGKNF